MFASILPFLFLGGCGGSASKGSADGGTRSADGGDSMSVTITVGINNCPDIVSASASPLSTSVGQTIDVVGMATDRDPADNLTYLWTAISGSFSDPSIAAPPYTCKEPGTHVLTLRVSDGKCDDVTTLPVTCI